MMMTMFHQSRLHIFTNCFLVLRGDSNRLALLRGENMSLSSPVAPNEEDKHFVQLDIGI